MKSNLDALSKLNMDIAQAESDGNRAFFEHLLTQDFAMRRADGTAETRGSFLSKVRGSPPRATHILSISLLGNTVATVVCVVEQTGKRYSNFRLFVGNAAGQDWKLLTWANEPI